eukprot:TRINITY_DN8247_c0_g1_i1.p1 TRINITY_DN8247_c0_g1~~TRINITY_DN8247_c0_g1_i1.p1  ORF type:complete len:199 (-),score=45.50 TRINITY_DN8247_c0_g1_i1:5-601(-)
MQFLQVTIDSLHKSLVDSQLGLKECASIVKDVSMKQKFECLATKRGEMMRELEIRGGAQKSTSGSIKGGLSRAWMDIKSSITGGGQNIMDSILKEEMNLKKTFDDALKSHQIPTEINGLLLEQMKKIDCDLTELETMFGEEGKQITKPTEEQHIDQTTEKQSMGEKIKATLGIGLSDHEKALRKQQQQQQQLSGRGQV